LIERGDAVITVTKRRVLEPERTQAVCMQPQKRPAVRPKKSPMLTLQDNTGEFEET